MSHDSYPFIFILVVHSLESFNRQSDSYNDSFRADSLRIDNIDNARDTQERQVHSTLLTSLNLIRLAVFQASNGTPKSRPSAQHPGRRRTRSALQSGKQ